MHYYINKTIKFVLILFANYDIIQQKGGDINDKR